MSQQPQLQPLASGASSGSPANGTTVPPLPASSVSSPFLGQSVIPLVNKLQDIFSQLGSASTIDLPQVLRSPFFVSARYIPLRKKWPEILAWNAWKLASFSDVILFYCKQTRFLVGTASHYTCLSELYCKKVTVFAHNIISSIVHSSVFCSTLD